MATEATLPLYDVDTTFPDTTGYVVKTVCASGCDYTTLQAAVNAIDDDGGHTNGEIIQLAEGETFTENVTLPNYAMTAGKWIIITTDTALPAEGVRIDPSYEPVLAKIITDTVNVPAIQVASSADHYWIVGIEVAIDEGLLSDFSGAILAIGANEDTVPELPSYIMVDRCYIHGHTEGAVVRGVQADGVHVAVMNSWIDEIHSLQDAQAVWAYNTPGPLLIHNNELQATGENVMFGGLNPDIPNSIPSDITITRNHLYKPLTWFASHPSYGGINWSIKNIFEIKNAQRVLLHGNIFENVWLDSQSGYAFVMTPRSGTGNLCTWCTNEDITIRYNVIMHAGNGIGIQSIDENGTPPSSDLSERITIHNNLWFDFSSAWGGDGSGIFLLLQMPIMSPTGSNLIVRHNTVIHSGNVMVVGESSNPWGEGFEFKDNIVSFGASGILGSGAGAGNLALDEYFPLGYDLTNNVWGNVPSYFDPDDYPDNNFYHIESWTPVGFVDEATCTSSSMTVEDIGACALSPMSDYYEAGTDMRDIGADIDAIIAAINGEESSLGSLILRSPF